MYYKAKVKERREDDNGKMKKFSVEFLVDAESVTEVEATVAKEYFGSINDWDLISVSETKVEKILESTDRADR